jgi:hypothetical protein
MRERASALGGGLTIETAPGLGTCVTAELPIPPEVEGCSFLPLAQGRDIPWRSYVHGEHTILGQSQHWITDGREKYLWWSGTGHEQLFALSDDPQELHNLAHTPSASQKSPSGDRS